MAGKKLSLQEFITKANTVHNEKYDYSLVENAITRNYAKIICPVHGIYDQRISAHLSGQGCRKCRNESVGTRFRYTKEDFIKDAILIHGNSFDYSQFIYVTDKTKGNIRCVSHDITFQQTPSSHKKTKGCPQCSRQSFVSNKRNTLQKTLDLCIKKHGIGTFDYSAIPANVHSHDRVQITCTTCGNPFEQLMYSHSNIGNGCPICKVSKDETYIGNFIQNELGIPIIRSDRRILDGKEIDILIPSQNFGIEINGNYWHSELISQEHKNYHLKKTELADSKGIFLIQLFGDEIFHKPEICKSIIRNKLGKSSNRVFARKCSIREVGVDEKNQFLDGNHIQGKDHSKVKLGLYLDEELVSLMTFGKPRYNQDVEWELIRFCNKLDTSVIGAASRLFKYFVNNFIPKSIISYADRRISNGDIYNTLGFSHTHNALPRYYYMHRNNYLIRYHRSNFTKERIKKLYPEVDIQNDEWSLMQSLGYDRIWDCGNKVYVWTAIRY